MTELAVLYIIVTGIAIIGVFASSIFYVKARRAKRAQTLAETNLTEYKEIADEAIDEATKRVKSAEEAFKKTLDEVRRQCDFKIGAVGRQVTNIVSDMSISRNSKVKAITDIKNVIDAEIELGYQL